MAKLNGFTTLTEAEMLEVVGGYFNPLDALKPTPIIYPGSNSGSGYKRYIPLPPNY